MPRGIRFNPEHDERTRAKIQTSQIINQLIKHVNGDVDMQNTQIRAAEILLKKTLPDLSAMAIGDYREPVKLGDRAVGWIESEIANWIETRISQTRGGVE